jgi:hypothetical protein
MGCHTWFSVPLEKNKDSIIKEAQKNLDTFSLSDDNKKMYQYAIDNELMDVCCDLGYPEYSFYDCIIYQDIREYSLKEYNRENGTTYDSEYHDDVFNKIELESYSNEPRISGYPERVIRSYDDMVDFMSTGFDDDKGNHHNFYYDEDRKETFMEGIKIFFEKHSEGIITFG